MGKAIKLTLTKIYVPNPEYYPKGASIEDMLAADRGTIGDWIFDVIQMPQESGGFKESWEIVEVPDE